MFLCFHSLPVFCQLYTEDERWYWQLNFGSILTIVSLLCHTCTLSNIYIIADVIGSLK